MRRMPAVLAALLLPALALGQGVPTADSPVEIDKVETQEVRLVLLDVVVVDRQGRTVPGLGAEDFEVFSGGKARAVDTLDVSCAAGALADAPAVRNPSRREAPAFQEGGRRVVLAVDYQHVDQIQRLQVLEQAKQVVEHGVAEGDELMVVALTGGLRIEQPFTADRERVARALHRMQYDVSLWNGHFAHLTESGFVGGLVTLLDFLSTVPGSKALVLFSSMSDVPLDAQFSEIAAIASASRCSIYPVDVRGLTTSQVGSSGDPPVG